MYRDNYLQKIKLLGYLDVGIWIKKKKDKVISNKIIAVSDSIKKKNFIVLDNFIKAVKKNDNKIKVLIKTESELKKLVHENNDRKNSEFFLIFCNDELIEYFANTPSKQITFCSLLSLDEITNQAKKTIWEEFLKFKNYE